MNRRRKLVIATVIAIPVALGSVSAAYAAGYRDKALPRTTVGPVSVAGMDRQEMAKAITQRANAVQVTLAAPETGEAAPQTVSLAELGYAVDVDATVDRVFASADGVSSYAKAIVSPTSVPAVIVRDDNTNEKYIAGLIGDRGTAGKNAKVTRAKGDTKFTVTPAVKGATIDPSSWQSVTAAAEKLESTSVTLKFAEREPAISTDKAQAVAEKANQLVAKTVSISADGKQYTASAKEKSSWVTIKATDTSLGDPTLDPTKVSAWVDAQAEKAKTTKVNGERTVSASGKVINVVKEGKDGTDVTNAADVAQAANAALADGKDYSGQFETKSVPASWTERKVAKGAENLAYQAADGEKWIDINLTRHTMTAYEGGRAVIGPVSMVNGAPDTPSLTGTHFVQRKYAADDMRGANVDGSRYSIDDVPYVTYFQGGYALHGAPWRSSFGYAASHGCINLPVSVAKQVYNFAPVGTRVVSHK